MTFLIISSIIISCVAILIAKLKLDFTIDHYPSKTRYIFNSGHLWRITYTKMPTFKDDKERVKKAYSNGGSYTEQIF